MALIIAEKDLENGNCHYQWLKLSLQFEMQLELQKWSLVVSTRTASTSTSTSTLVTSRCTSTHNSQSSTTQVLDHVQWVVTTCTQIGQCLSFTACKQIRSLSDDDDDMVADTDPPATYSIHGAW